MITQELVLFQSLWGFCGTLEQAIARALSSGFDGLEVNLRHPALKQRDPQQIANLLEQAGLTLILELVSGGDYVPSLDVSWQQHLEDLEQQLKQADRLQPLRINLITGSDSWSSATQDRFLSELLDRLDQCRTPVSLETHRSRCLFNPWAIAEQLSKHPRLRLTADISHWCAVSERLLTPELEPIQAIAPRVDHIHARVGHSQGPSVGHPFAPESADALEAHRRCWQLFALHQQQRHQQRQQDGHQRPRNGHHCITITPEFGPDGYLPTLPFTGMAVADLDGINTAMAQWLRAGALER